jgi:ElaB/YqjD/DUF883 family membrane-anchored ribosome-binding protein
MPLKAFTSPPLGRAASDRLDKASRNSPALKFGERDSEGVRALQSALLLLEDPTIDIPAGVTGNFLDQTAAAVKAFQKRNRLAVDGVAGRQTITLLDSIMADRGQRSLQRLDRVLVDLRRQYSDDVERQKILREMELHLLTIRRGNELGLAIALPVVALIVIAFFILIWLSLPQTQRVLRELLRRTLEAVNERGEVAQEKLQELKQEVRKLLDQVREFKNDCMTEALANDALKHAECLRKFATANTVAFQALIRILDGLLLTVYDGFGRGKLRIPPSLRVQTLAKAFKDYMNAVNDLLRCMDCPEILIPEFPSFPDFPFL